uniref:Nad1_b n=1 Tax=Urostyla grandis TaxID=57509 RepID=A0A2I4PEM5_9SPIT|nr:Nad1_b [Urostyla grandis]
MIDCCSIPPTSILVLKVNIEILLLLINELIETYIQFSPIMLINGWRFFISNQALVFGLKFLLVIMFLILIRGGTPRYRYDYLTKLGWLKFIGLAFTAFIVAIILVLVV